LVASPPHPGLGLPHRAKRLGHGPPLFPPASSGCSVFQPKPSDHEKYGGDPQQPHKLHLITRIRSVIGRPYWEKKIVKDFGLVKAHQPKVHKNIPSVNSKLRVIKHLISAAIEVTAWGSDRGGNGRHLS
uniref:Large ribosomal subunit protein uL30m n=1 Tax=Crocodylus porosus TaxID=8502 RepID=A0A7M4EZN6_CROPO